ANEYAALIAANTGGLQKDAFFFCGHKARLARRYFPGNPARLLEFGCGVGRNIPFIRSYFPDSKVFGCDISGKSIACAQKKNPAATFFASKDLPARGTFDLIFIANVLHHVPVETRAEVVRQLQTALTPGGRVFCFEHNPYNPLTRYFVSTCIFDRGVKLLTLRQLTRLFLAQKFTILEKKYILFSPFKFSFLQKIEPALGAIPLGGQYFLSAGLQ
ncbi:MAG: class I SAM-dependent methyltransferase, partial [Chitinivibrionales bacterium]|nr:class I SAM-dependent methyltransferase [Chitinivibrionales bacterium]